LEFIQRLPDGSQANLEDSSATSHSREGGNPGSQELNFYY